MGKTQPYDAGISPQSSTTRPANRRLTGSGTAISSSSPRSTWANSAPTCRAVMPDEPSAPMITLAETTDPSASRALALSPAWSTARTSACCRSTAPCCCAWCASAASNSARVTIASSGSRSDRVSSLPPRRVNVTDRIWSLAGSSICPATAPSDAPIRPPPHVLYLGCSARSRMTVRAPAAAAALAAASPAGPPPTTATSHSARSLCRTPAAYAEPGRVNWPRKSGRPDAVSAIMNRNGRSKTSWTSGCGLRSTAIMAKTAAVAAAASVPSSATST